MGLLRRWLVRTPLRRESRLPCGERETRPVRHSLVRYEVSRHIHIDRYWKSLSSGRGPACVVRVHGAEVLRFDCFGPRKGHYHVPMGSRRRDARRIYFDEQSAEQQIERSVKELRTNLRSHLERHPSRRFRRVALDPHRLDAVCDALRAGMLHDLRTVPELQEARLPGVRPEHERRTPG